VGNWDCSLPLAEELLLLLLLLLTLLEVEISEDIFGSFDFSLVLQVKKNSYVYCNNSDIITKYLSLF